MSPRLRIWGACRALAVRSRPVAPRTEPFINSLPRTRWYSDESNNQPPKPIDNSIKPETSQEGTGKKIVENAEQEAPELAGQGQTEVGERRASIARI